MLLRCGTGTANALHLIFRTTVARDYRWNLRLIPSMHRKEIDGARPKEEKDDSNDSHHFDLDFFWSSSSKLVN